METPRTRRLAVAALCVAAHATGCAPFLVFPGGSLRGAPAASAVEDWGFTASSEYVEIETRPERPYSVQIYGVGAGKDFYIASQGWRGALNSPSRARWIAHLAEDPRIRLSVDGAIYELRAVRVDAAAEVARVRQLFAQKYGDAAEGWGFWRGQPDPLQASDVFVYRLDPR